IRQAITRGLADQARTVRIPVHMIQTVSSIQRYVRTQVQQTGLEPKNEDIAEALGLSVDEVRRAKRFGAHPIPLDMTVGEDGSLIDVLEDENALQPHDQADRAGLKDKMEVILKSLTYREREIIKLRKGFPDGYVYTLEEVGRIFKVTRERVRQIEAK